MDSGTIEGDGSPVEGVDDDPQVTLAPEELSQADFSSAVLSKLAQQGPDSTRYQVKGEVARGGMGAVLRVWDEGLRRHLAMKVMLGQGVADEHGDTPSVDPRSLARFLEEAQVTGQLDHPGIVPVHELGLDAEGRVYFTMKLVKGKTLRQVFDELERGEGGWTQTRVLGLIQKVCDAMSYAHAKGVIHRDLKPANVMVGKFGEVYVMDWGLARILGRDDERDIRPRTEPQAMLTSEVRSARQDRSGSTPDMSLMTMDGDVVGTPAYMPPEQARGDLPAMGPHSDVYAVGAMLYHLLAGHMPYVPRDARVNNYAVWQRVQEGPPRPLHEVAPAVPAELAAICERAMAREASQRYADMAALADDLSAYVEGRVVRAYETGTWAETRKWVRRNKALAASLAGAAGLLLVGFVSSSILKAQSDANAERAEAETAKVFRLSAYRELERLRSEADDLWPPGPDRLTAYDAWLGRAHALVAGLETDPSTDIPGHRAQLREVRDRALPWTAEDRARDRESAPRAGELAEREAELQSLIEQFDQAPLGEDPEDVYEPIEQLEAEVASLNEEVERRRTYRFDEEEDAWWHDELERLVREIEAFADPDAGLWKGLSAEHGIGVERRRAFAARIEERTRSGPDAAKWEATQERIAANPKYGRLEIAAQLGLAPLGPDPVSGFEEFVHLLTGAAPDREPDGSLRLTAETGLVLVLLPGGAFRMGRQDNLYEKELSPFFLSKYEMTQAQWKRLTGHNPSGHGPESLWRPTWLASGAPPSLLHPVEQVSWLDCQKWLPRAGLALPSEAQWEYAARGGTVTLWWTGDEPGTLEGAANVMDRTGNRNNNNGRPDAAMWDDGASVHAPVGTYAANPFGLHDVAGNVAEWCLDALGAGIYAEGAGPRLDPANPGGPDTRRRILRGGSHKSNPQGVKSAQRNFYPPIDIDFTLGVRPARAVDD